MAAIVNNLYLAPVPLSIFRSNSKFDENSKHSSVKYTWPITTIFCTRHDSVTVVTCAKYRCDRNYSVLNFHRISNSIEICLVGQAPDRRREWYKMQLNVGYVLRQFSIWRFICSILPETCAVFLSLFLFSLIKHITYSRCIFPCILHSHFSDIFFRGIFY